MAKGWGIVQDSQGNAIDACEVKVYLAGTSTLASIFSDSALSVAIDQVNAPVTTDATGHYQFFILAGTSVKLVGTKGTFTFTEDNVDVGTGVIDHGALSGLADDDHAQYALLAGRGGGQTILQGMAIEGGLVVNDLGADVDFRVEGDTEPNLVVVDAGTNRVGIGISGSTSRLHVREDSASEVVLVQYQNGGGGALQVRFSIATIVWADRIGADNHYRLRDVTNGTEPIFVEAAAPTNSVKIASDGRVGIGTSPATSAKLDVSSTTGAVLLPRMTTAQRDALTAANGMVIYNTTTSTIQGRQGGAWTNL